MYSGQHQHIVDSIMMSSVESMMDTTVYYRPRTPAQVLRLLPRDATPAQQDSAIQAMLDIPEPTHLSTRPDTLYIPGLESDPPKIDLSQAFYKNGYFTESEYLHPELHVTQIGIAAEPIPYRLRDDDYVTGVLLLSFFLVAMFLVHSSHILAEKIKNLFYKRGNDDELGMNSNTKGELQEQLLLFVQVSFILSIFFFDYTQKQLTHVFNSVSPYILLGVNAGLCFAYYVAKMGVYQFVNWTFFERLQRRRWADSYVLIVMLMGLALFPLALLLVYFEIPLNLMKWSFICIVGLSKLLIFFKSRQILLDQKNSLFHLILYFCTLELIPMMLLWHILVYCNEILVVNI